MFRIGDEVQAIHLRRLGTWYDDSVSRLRLDTTYTVAGFTPRGEFGLILAEVQSSNPEGAWNPTRFRKVQKRNSSLTYESFLTIKPGQFEEPRRVNTPAKRKERA